jgi:multiple sugar transport system substrate-binding protein
VVGSTREDGAIGSSGQPAEIRNDDLIDGREVRDLWSSGTEEAPGIVSIRIDRDHYGFRRAARRTISVILALAVAGCSSTSMLNVPQDPKAEIQIWLREPARSPTARTADRLVKAFIARTGYRAKLVAVYEDFETKLQQQAAYRRLPDVIINDTGQLGAMQSQGWLQRIDRETFPGGDQVSDRAWQAARAVDGNYYGVPLTAHTFALYVHADWRARLGLPVPKTWDDIAKMAVAFTTRDPDGDGRADTYGLVVPGTTKRGYMSWYLASYLYSNGAEFLTATRPGRWIPAINSAKALQATGWMKDMFCKYHVVNPDAIDLDTARSHDTFEKDIGGIYLTGPYMLARFVKSMGSDKIEVFPLPGGPSGSPSALAEGENVYLTVGSRNKAAQRAFAQFAASVEGQTIAMDGDDNGPVVRLPVNTKVDMGAVRHDPRWRTFQQVYSADSVYAPSVPNWAPFRQMSADVLNGVMANCGSDVKAALDKLAGQFTAELKRQNVYGG